MWQERDFTPDEAVIQMCDAPDRAAFVLDQPMSGPPGVKFQYNSGNPYVLSAVITRKTGKNPGTTPNKRCLLRGSDEVGHSAQGQVWPSGHSK